MSTFARVFLERYSDELAPEQIEAMAVWGEKLCEVSVADREAASVHRAAALVCVQELFATFADEIVRLQKKNLRDVAMSNQAHSYAEWMRAQNCFVRDFHLLTVEESDLLEDWELVLCDTSVAFLPRLERSFTRVTAFVAEHSEQLRAKNKKALVENFREQRHAIHSYVMFLSFICEKIFTPFVGTTGCRSGGVGMGFVYF